MCSPKFIELRSFRITVPCSDVADLISKTSKSDIRLLYARASLRESKASLAMAQDEITENLRQVIAAHREDISKLPVQSTTELMPSSVADDGLFQSLARGQDRLSFEVKEVRQMMEQFILSAQSRRTELNTHPIVQYRDNMDAQSSVETIRMGLGTRPDPPTNHGFHAQPTLAESRRSTSPVQMICASANFQGIRQLTLLNGLKRVIIPFGTRHQRQVAASNVTYFLIYILFLVKVRLTSMSSLHLSNHRRPHKPQRLNLSLTKIWTTSIYQTLPIIGIWNIWKPPSSRRSKSKARSSHSRSNYV